MLSTKCRPNVFEYCEVIIFQCTYLTLCDMPVKDVGMLLAASLENICNLLLQSQCFWGQSWTAIGHCPFAQFGCTFIDISGLLARCRTHMAQDILTKRWSSYTKFEVGLLKWYEGWLDSGTRARAFVWSALLFSQRWGLPNRRFVATLYSCENWNMVEILSHL